MASDVTVDLVRALIENMQGHRGDWEALAMILEFPDGRFNSAHGYAYSPGDVISAVASHPRAVAPAVAAYTASYYQPEAPLPRKLLVQFDRTSGKYEITFEDKDESRWEVTPHTLLTLREELRPKFD